MPDRRDVTVALADEILALAETRYTSLDLLIVCLGLTAVLLDQAHDAIKDEIERPEELVDFIKDAHTIAHRLMAADPRFRPM